MKKLIFVYIVSVLLFAGFAHASVTTNFLTQVQYQAPITIQQVSLAPNGRMLYLGGVLPNPCYTVPSAMLTQSQDNPNVLVLHMTSPTPLHACIAKVKPYLATVNLPFLVQVSKIQIDKNAQYLITTEGSNFKVEVSGSDLL